MNVLEKIKEVKTYYEKAYGFQLTEKQLKVIESKKNLVEEVFERREGCSTAAMIKAIEFAINNQRSSVLFIVPNRNIANIRIDEMRQFLSNELLSRQVIRITKNPGQVEFLDGSIIRVIGGNAMSMRGLIADCAIIEPTRYVDYEAINVARMCTFHRGDAQVVMLDQEDKINGQPIII